METNCWIFHDWSKWKQIKVPVVPFDYVDRKIVDTPGVQYTETKQERYCERCGLTQRRDV